MEALVLGGHFDISVPDRPATGTDSSLKDLFSRFETPTVTVSLSEVYAFQPQVLGWALTHKRRQYGHPPRI